MKREDEQLEQLREILFCERFNKNNADITRLFGLVGYTDKMILSRLYGYFGWHSVSYGIPSKSGILGFDTISSEQGITVRCIKREVESTYIITWSKILQTLRLLIANGEYQQHENMPAAVA